MENICFVVSAIILASADMCVVYWMGRIREYFRYKNTKEGEIEFHKTSKNKWKSL